ncbi:peptidoglycan D,D-transpeptidase FtsI family protein [Actinophytocola gossypii]|uniref:Penicillin-binding protein 2 n=1 Tax=Actinophytocola gossypii TaxID=2812003 RepID=A0ABT2JCN0_9PSEU|nr:penicillin-binding protein 2 [Actinophytocola gossypii]MCT2585220.1 penicillin-binding protein 2 [Actinophytocola gossypii]
MPPAGKPPDGRRPDRGWPALPGRRTPGAPRSGRPTPPRRAPWHDDDSYPDPPPPRPIRRGSDRDALPPWREALRRKARAEAAAEARPRGARSGPRAGAASARRSAPAPRHSTGTARRVSTGPRRIVRKPTGNHHVRVLVVRFLLVGALVAAGLKLIQVQGFEAEALAAKAEQQRTTTFEIPAVRGAILDRDGTKLAFSVEARMLAFQPNRMREEYAEATRNNPAEPIDFDQRTEEIARAIHEVVGDRVSEEELLAKLRKDASYVFLVGEVEPAAARDLTERYPEIIDEYRSMREYPGRSLASNIVGVANWRMDDPDVDKHNLHGLSGLEALRDKVLSGTPGREVKDTTGGSDTLVIPGSDREIEPAVDGSNLVLTIDSDLQYFLQQALADYMKRAEAEGGSAVVLDSHTGEVYALANDTSFDPTGPLDTSEMGNPAVTTPYEPGSVAKVVTALCTIQEDISEPQDVHMVAGTHQVADRTISDAWPHGTLPFTTTGIFAKSSNVGTLMLAEECGKDRFSALLEKLGLGQRTGVGLPGESPGRVPPRGQWSGSTFGNLPIGQGMSMTVLQMAAMYQAVANGGVRVPPRIVDAVVTPDGERIPEPDPKPVRVVSEDTAKTVRDMFRAVVQDGDGLNDGTGEPGSLTGYQISGKTGTAQQIDPETGSYSNSLYWVTFAGILPANDPRFVVGIMIDRPNYSGGEIEGRSAAPLFHDIASYLTQRYNIPLSKKASPVVPLIAD